LDKLDEPESLTWLDAEVAARLPSVDLPEMLLEVHGWVPYLDDFTNVSDSAARARDMHVSVAAVLCAEATNTGLKPVINEGREALRRGRLFWVEQNYVRDECCSRATARMVAFHAAQPIVANWGGGELASADGLRFVTPIRTINSRPNPHYFGPGARRGVTFYNFLFDMYVGFNGIIVPGTQRDSLYILDGLLEQDSGIRPVEITADTAGASEIVFGLFRLMGYRFSPRLADAGSATLYRIDPEADYGQLNSLTRDKIRIGLIKDNWDDILRLAASLRTGNVKASEMLRVLTPGGRPTTLGKAIMEIGRLDRSAFLAMYFNDAIFRRKVNRQLNRQESRHQLARRIYHGQKGELRKKYREGQEDQLGALGLVLNVVVLWNTVYIQKIVEELRAEGHHIRDEDIARISPLDFAHINFHGRYTFALPAEVTAGGLRPTPRPQVGRTVC
jgi:TnpA family transposase